MLLTNSSIENGQRVSVLAVTSTNSTLPSTATTDEFIKEVTYEKIASVLRQCDNYSPKMNSDHATKYLSASSVSPNGFQKRYKNKERRKLTPEQLADLKRKSKCRQCEKYGHWKSDHFPDGQLKPAVKSTDTAPDTDNVSQGRPKNTVTFNMVQVNGSCSHETSFDFNIIGPLLDDGAPYSGMGLREFTVLQPILLPNWKGTMHAVPDVLQDYSYWQYGNGDHSSDPRRILGSVPLCIKTDEGNVMSVRHLIIEGSSQWVIGRNVTMKCNIQHIGGNKLVLRDSNDTEQLRDVGFHSYLPYERFVPSSIDFSKHVSSQLYCATAQIHENITHRPWNEKRKVIEKVHRHVCGHSKYHDMKLLLERNKIWNAEVKKYPSQVLDSCPDCLTTSQAQSTRKVSLSSLSRNFNDVLCVDHYHLDGNRIFHIMDSVARYSVGDVVQEMNMSTAIPIFESLWVSAFWEPKVVLYGSAFDNSEFTMYLESHNIECRPLPPRRHNKNVIESKHRVIRDIFIRLKGSSNDTTINRERLLVQQAMRISNDLYGNDVCSAHELTKGYTRPLAGNFPAVVPEEIIQAHQNLIAERKLTKILKSKAITNAQFCVGDLVQIYVKNQHQKRGKWSSSKVVLSYDKESGTVTVPGKNGCEVRAAVEDVRPACKEDTLEAFIQEAMDQMADTLDSLIDEKCSYDNREAIEDSVPHPPSAVQAGNFDFESDQTLVPAPSVGDSIDIYCPLDDKFYTGTVTTYDENENKYAIHYNDGDKECLDLENETWRFSNPDIMSTNSLQVCNTSLESSEQVVLKSFIKVFGHKDFMKFQAQGLPTFPTVNAYAREESVFKKNVKLVPISKVPKTAHNKTSHVIYKVKINDDTFYKMKARIAPHGNKDREKAKLKTDSSTCPPTGIRILLSLATLFQWCLAKIDFESAFLQTGRAKRDVYVVPPRESNHKNFLWLLLTASYGLVNANAKWQEQSDELLLSSLGFTQLVYVPQLFYKCDSSGLTILAAVKIVDDVLIAGNKNDIADVITKVQRQYKLGTIIYGPGCFLYYGLQICQSSDFTISIHADDKLEQLQGYPITRYRRKQCDDLLNDIEMASYRSLCSSIG